MARFTVRVELRDAAADDYEDLHAAMEEAGFERRIRGQGGVLYDLPPAEYRYEGGVDMLHVGRLAKAAAALVKRRYAVLVTEGPAHWFGLLKSAQ